MKRCVLLIVTFFCAFVSIAKADDISGRTGLTIRGGYLIPSDMNDLGANAKPSYDLNAGIIHGVGGANDDLALELEATYSKYNFEANGFKVGEFEVYDIGLGVQHRFNTNVYSTAVPYLGFGADVILPKLKLKPDQAVYEIITAQTGIGTGSLQGAIGVANSSLEVDQTYGAHLKIGSDFFINRHLVFNVETKGLVGKMSDITLFGTKIGRYKPHYGTAMLGLRYYF